MFSMVLGLILCHLGYTHARTPLLDLKQIKRVFHHYHMPYSVKHMVAAHLKTLVECHSSLSGGAYYICLFCVPSQPLLKLFSMCSLYTK